MYFLLGSERQRKGWSAEVTNKNQGWLIWAELIQIYSVVCSELSVGMLEMKQYNTNVHLLRYCSKQITAVLPSVPIEYSH